MSFTIGGSSNNNAILQLSKTNKRTKSIFDQLSSGKRVNSAKDDPSALAVASGLESSMRALSAGNQAISQTQGALQTASGALSSTAENLQRARELAVQASNGTLSDSDRTNLQKEFDSTISQIDQTARSTSFNGTNLLDGSYSTSVNTNGDPSSSTSVSVGSSTASALGINTAGISTQSSAQDALEKIDSAIAQVNAQQASIGAQYNALDSAASANSVESENLAAAKSQAVDANYAELTSSLQQEQVLAQAQIATLKAQQKNSKDLTKSLLSKI